MGTIANHGSVLTGVNKDVVFGIVLRVQKELGKYGDVVGDLEIRVEKGKVQHTVGRVKQQRRYFVYVCGIHTGSLSDKFVNDRADWFGMCIGDIPVYVPDTNNKFTLATQMMRSFPRVQLYMSNCCNDNNATGRQSLLSTVLFFWVASNLQSFQHILVVFVFCSFLALELRGAVCCAQLV